MNAIDPERLAGRLDQVRAVMNAHAGGVELIDVSGSGVVHLRFTGMCAGCPFRPLTMAGTIGPAVMDVPGVSAVRADGARISDEATARIRRYLGPESVPPLPPVEAPAEQ